MIYLCPCIVKLLIYWNILYFISLKICDKLFVIVSVQIPKLSLHNVFRMCPCKLKFWVCIANFRINYWIPKLIIWGNNLIHLCPCIDKLLIHQNILYFMFLQICDKLFVIVSVQIPKFLLANIIRMCPCKSQIMCAYRKLWDELWVTETHNLR